MPTQELAETSQKNWVETTSPEPPKDPGQPPEPESVFFIQGAYREKVRFREGGKIRFSRVSARPSSWASPGEAREGVWKRQYYEK